MNKNAGYIVETKTGKIGRTYHREAQINKKTVVHIEGEDKPLLCDPKTLKITGYVD